MITHDEFFDQHKDAFSDPDVMTILHVWNERQHQIMCDLYRTGSFLTRVCRLNPAPSYIPDQPEPNTLIRKEEVSVVFRLFMFDTPAGSAQAMTVVVIGFCGKSEHIVHMRTGAGTVQSLLCLDDTGSPLRGAY